MAAASVTENLPVVSVCVANYNGMAVIDDCLRSVLDQQGDIFTEILVHDDASTDGSPAYIREHYPSVKLMESAENVGFCIANNRMAAVAKGRFLLLLNNDAALYSDALQNLVLEADRLGRPAIFGLPQYDATSNALVDIGCRLDPFLNPVPNLDIKRNDVAMVIGACLCIPKSLWDELGGFPEWFGSIAEDMYLCCRARLAGYGVRALTVSGYRHWQGKSFGGNRLVGGSLVTTFRRRALSERNKSFVMALIYPSPWMYPILSVHMLLLMFEGGLLTMLKKDQRIWRDIYAPCFKDIWRTRSFLRELRRDVQHSRRVSAREFFSAFSLLPHKLYMLVRYGLPQVY